MILRIFLVALLFEVLRAQEFYIDEEEEMATAFVKQFIPALRERQEQETTAVTTTTTPGPVLPDSTTAGTSSTAVVDVASTEVTTATAAVAETSPATPATAPPATAALETTSNVDIPESLINCNNFNKYKAECAKSALSIYNYTKNVPPPPVTFDDWCDSLQVIVECAKEWNAECEEASNFNEDTIAGLNHVIEFLCDDFNFVSLYKESTNCVYKATKRWGSCYKAFTSSTFVYSNVTAYPVHYQSHFFLCCERMRFRTCTMKVLTDKCSKKQAMVLQKFSTAVSFGDVYQDCDPNLVYKNCPGGDPRPSDSLVAKLTAADYIRDVDREDPELLARDSTDLTAVFTIWLIVLSLILYHLF